MTTADVDAIDPEGHHRADAGLSQRLIGSDRGLSGLELETDSVIEGVTIGLARGDQHVLARFRYLRILNGSVHLFEEADV